MDHKKKFFDSNFYKRLASIIILLPLALGVLFTENIPLLNFLLILLTIIMTFEWANITSKNHNKRWVVFGSLYLAIFLFCSLYLVDLGDLIFAKLIILVWCVDVGAYVFGKLIGGPRIMPSISPSKTWVGLIGAVIVSAIYIQFILKGSAVCALTFSIVSQAGDFLESWFKRCHGVKDSGNVIPGHGGVLDRMDGVISSVIFYAIFYSITGLQLL